MAFKTKLKVISSARLFKKGSFCTGDLFNSHLQPMSTAHASRASFHIRETSSHAAPTALRETAAPSGCMKWGKVLGNKGNPTAAEVYKMKQQRNAPSWKGESSQTKTRRDGKWHWRQNARYRGILHCGKSGITCPDTWKFASTQLQHKSRQLQGSFATDFPLRFGTVHR